MRKTNILIKWLCGSENDTLIGFFKKAGISWRYDHFGRLEADLYGIGAFYRVHLKRVSADIYELVFEFKEV